MISPLIISKTTSLYGYDRYDDEEKSFVLKGEEKNEIYFKYHLTPDFSFDNKEFQIHFFAKKNLNENDIYQVKDLKRDKTRIGWCIPINALESSEHSYAENPHFLKYAFVATKMVLQYISLRENFEKLDKFESSYLKLSDFFHESTAVLVISNETLEEDFEIDRFIPSMQSYGYVKLKEIHPDLIQIVKIIPAGTESLELLPISKNIKNVFFVSSIFSGVVAYEKSSVFKFFYLYQIFELLIEVVFDSEQQNLISALTSSEIDSSQAKDIFDKSKELTSEKRRLALLFTKYGCDKVKLQSLKNECNKFLLAINKPEGANIVDFFYPIRNFLFHRLRDLPAEKSEYLESVISEICDVLPEVLAAFCVPALPTLPSTKPEANAKVEEV